MNLAAQFFLAVALFAPGVDRPELRFGLPPGFAIDRPGYVAIINGKTKCPDLVVEHLTADELAADLDRTGLSFKADDEVPAEFRATDADYKGSPYSRGHMFPAADAGTEEEMRASFSISNACPQLQSFNAGAWLKLERACRNLVRGGRYEEAWIFSGPLWLAGANTTLPADELRVRTIGASKVWVPTHFFKVIVARRGNELGVFAIVLPHTAGSDIELDNFKASVDAVERASGLDLLHALDDELEDELEGATRALPQ